MMMPCELCLSQTESKTVTSIPWIEQRETIELNELHFAPFYHKNTETIVYWAWACPLCVEVAEKGEASSVSYGHPLDAC